MESSATPINMNILVGCTGSVASVKAAPLVSLLLSRGYNVKLVATSYATHFFAETPNCEILTDKDEWNMWKKMGDPVLHIELRNWADVFVIAPLDANTLAKIASGMCDNLLTCILRAWDTSNRNNKSVLVCPAMNTAMWNHPFTEKHLNILRNDLNYVVIDPVVKKLACGDIGTGAMAEVSTIAAKIDMVIQEKVHITQ